MKAVPYPYLWICSFPPASVQRILRESKIRWKEGPILGRHKKPGVTGTALYIHHKDLAGAARLLNMPATTKDGLLSFRSMKPALEASEKEMIFCFIHEAKYAADQVDWAKPGAADQYLACLPGPEYARPKESVLGKIHNFERREPSEKRPTHPEV